MGKNRFRPVLGIDLGTTNSAVARVFEGESEIIELENGEKLLPSVVHVSTEGDIIVGEDAKSALLAMPERTVAEVKRKLGAEEKIELADQELSPTEISALILKKLKESVDKIYGPEVEKEAVVTVPAYFTDQQRKATKKAGELAGFVVERIINEPTAAAMAYGLNKLDQEQHFLVYDLGGGTFDVSIVEMNSGIMEVKASRGDRQLGGSDFDWRLIDYLSQKVIEDVGVDPRDDLQAVARLKDEAEKAKIKLSEQEQVKISISALLVKDDQPVGLEVEISREEFVKLIDDLLLDTLESVKEVLVDAELEKNEVDEILLVGGSTRIPRVVELLTDFFEQEPHYEINPDEAVALGAAVQAGLKSGALGESGLIVTDVAPYSMGVEVLKGWLGLGYRPGGFAKIIERNTTIPVTKTEKFSTSYDNQEAASIKIYQGEGEWVEENHYLGEFLLEDIPENEAGAEEIEVSFNYNLNGILDVRAKLLSTGEEVSITVEDGLDRDSESDYQQSVEELENFFKKAKENREQEETEILGDLFAEEELEDVDFDELVEEIETEEGLIEEAKRLKERVLETFRDDSKKKEELISKLEEAIDGVEYEELEETVDLVFAEIMQQELGGEE
ncbi:Hsp70 family protein [Fuchsiella alkaliacetigena]|uniref:Hsp70 family protein n=1 Tax=Fuchsiella alkaliacetigena TaxID=957042 RepID=UPI00200A4003|nr:Hsp70 family protein [Fuchsiella alkaliacetigena]MCK8825745.1 Hsp70 family protein [Fuchsiella alkaliacetigena]